jgi:hypothetical protein
MPQNEIWKKFLTFEVEMKKEPLILEQTYMKILGFSSQYNKNQDHSRTFAILLNGLDVPIV